MTIRNAVLKAMVMLMILPSSIAHSSQVTQSEMALARRWTAVKLEGTLQTDKPQAGLIVKANNDPVQRNSRNGRPMNIAGTVFTKGLYCHAVSEVVVRLPSPARKFTALVGVDTNEQTSGGRGSVVFSVENLGKELFRSEVIREGHKAVPVSADLNGSEEFTLKIGDGGDGIACDQSDWADAKVEMMDGTTLWIGELPMLDKMNRTFLEGTPFSFKYDGQPSAGFLAKWKCERASAIQKDGRTKITATYTDPATGLQVRCVGFEYKDFPIVEWTVYFKNTGDKDTPIISDIQAIDSVFTRTGAEDFVLHHHLGSPCLATDYRPFDDPLPASETKRITTNGGRPSNSDWPYFNVSWGNEGVICVVGWPGQWAADFARDNGNNLTIRAGQELTHFTLHPDEEVRTPLIVLQFWQGDRMDAQNVWRRFMLEHNLPRPFGKTVRPHLAACSSHQYGEMIHADGESQKMFVDRYLEESIKLDYWWMDAGWYPNEQGWPQTGTWEVDEKRFPGGLRAITDHAHAKDVKSIVWFEPERVHPGTWLYTQHPEWLLGKDGEQKLLNLGNPEARAWLTEHVDKLLNEQGIDLYRQDFNIDPLSFWHANDAEDRQGITEIRHIEGYLAYWDELRRRHPNMLIDSCASGGRRNDLETLRRAVPLLRSDYILEPTGQQNHTYGLSYWVPAFGSGANAFDAYTYRSVMCYFMNDCYDLRKKDSNWAAVRKLTAEWRKVTQYFIGDYYPLSAYDPGNAIWMAWQFDRPDLQSGVVQAFRRPGSPYESARYRLRGLDPAARYKLINDDATKTSVATGKELMTDGLLITLKESPGSAVIFYEKEKTK